MAKRAPKLPIHPLLPSIRQLWLRGLIPHSALVGVRVILKSKKMQYKMVVIAISHPDQGDF
jgi:hypothetical protein